MTFNDLGLIDPILEAISEAKYTTPTKIQAEAIPHILKGKDIIGCAQTGTGKTAAFSIPLLQILSKGHYAGIRTLIVTPTRELAIQIKENIDLYGKNLPLKSLAIFGGVPQGKQVKGLKSKVDILIATPGRLLDLTNQGFIKLSDVEILVLDEADRMLDMGFIHDIKKILTKLPSKKHTLFFSATMPPNIRKLANSILYKPVEVNVTPVSSTAETLTQMVYYVEKSDKVSLLIDVIKEEEIERTLIFTRTKHGADRLVKNLGKRGIQAAVIHGNKSQNARQRALEEFKSKKLTALIATDIAARGIDIDDLKHVINYEIPNVPETYVHRIGRAGRAGLAGTAISFCDSDERADFKNIQKLIGLEITVK